MDVTESTRETVDSWIAALEARYDGFDVVEKTWDHAPADYRQFLEQARDGTLGGAGVWVTDDGAVLSVRNEGDDGWGEPGGKREDGESFVVL
jgi:hypothetical protein